MEKISLKLHEFYSLEVDLNGLTNQQTGEVVAKGLLSEKIKLTTKYWLSDLNKKATAEKEAVESLKEELIKKHGTEDKDGNYMAKQQLFTIGTLALQMWEILEDDEQLDDWMESKIAQAEQSIVSVVKAYMYDEVVDDMKGMETLNYNDIVIGK